MIKKLEDVYAGIISKKDIILKINELVDTVDELKQFVNSCDKQIGILAEQISKLQTRAENVQSDTESRPENVQDPYTEQRKWIGKLCMFWNDYKSEYIVDFLRAVSETRQTFPFRGNKDWYKNCEPIYPASAFIYQG